MKSYAYCFEYSAGKLEYFSLHDGDFTEEGFRWSEQRELQFEERNIPDSYHLQALGHVEKILNHLLTEKEKAVTYEKRDKCERFLSPLERILEKGREVSNSYK